MSNRLYIPSNRRLYIPAARKVILGDTAGAFSTNSTLFDGVNDYFEMGYCADAAFAYNQPWSLTAWLKLSSLPSYAAMLWSNVQAGSLYPGWSIYQQSDSRQMVLIIGNDDGSYAQVAQTFPFSPEDWFFFGITKGVSGDVSAFTMYENGAVRGTSNTGGPLTGIMTPVRKFTVGASAWTPDSRVTRRWPGYMDDWAIWSRELTVGEMLEAYNGGLPADLAVHSRAADLLIYQIMGDDALDDFTSATGTIRDLSGRGNHAIPMNTSEVATRSTDVPS